SGRDAAKAWIGALAAGGLVLEVGFEDRLIFLGERRVLPASSRPARIPRRALAGPDPDPLAFPVWIARLIDRRFGGGGGRIKRRDQNQRQRDRGDQAATRHGGQ